MAMLEVNDLSVRYGSVSILQKVSFSLEENQWLMVIGPNGAGKSTLISAVSQYTPYTGRIFYQGRDLKTFRPRELARFLGVLSQNHAMEYSFTVEEVVRMGRYAHTTGLFSVKKDEKRRDEEAIQEALELTGLTSLASQSVLTLSGGELQRTFLAQTLAQEPRLLILDEPTNHLDLVYQKQVFEVVKEWVKGSGRAAISVVHDLSLVRAYGTHGLLLDRGTVLAQGELEDVCLPEHLNRAYSMNVYEWMRTMLGQWEEK